MAEAVAALEGSLELDRCAIDERRCTDREFPCGLHLTWSEAHADLIANLSGLTLAEAVRRSEANERNAGRRRSI